MAAHILRNWNISFAASGIDAIEHIRNNPDTHIILMDIRMPEMDGITATRIIRNELATKATIIAVSGEALETTVEECFEAGMNAFISKPFEREQLLRTILLHYAPLRQMQPDLIKLRPVDKLSGLRGLVVEDNKMIQLLTMRYLRDLECIAELAVDIKTALEKIAINQYDFILLDLHLPDGTGYEVAQSVRKNKESHTCLIAYSGEDSDETRAKCKAAGINGIILKSYHTSQELAIKINRFIDEFLSNRAHLEQQKLSKSAQTDYDLTKVNEIIGENTEDFVMLLKMFVEHSGTTLNQLIEASEKDDLVTLSRHAHSLKSSAKQFGMDRAAELLFALELRTGILDADQRKAMCSELREIFDRALPNIVSDIEKMKG
jgi:CheY-like chemotaxis protein